MNNSAAYIRVSSRTQDHATQRAAIERAAAARGDSITTWYSEKRSAKSRAIRVWRAAGGNFERALTVLQTIEEAESPDEDED
ncbi:MAG: recombinase family protein [Polyangiaceae bacterium]|jgi:DNA invertase Pin-like site-specific DNA recombinase